MNGFIDSVVITLPIWFHSIIICNNDMLKLIFIQVKQSKKNILSIKHYCYWTLNPKLIKANNKHTHQV